jgi:multimeric flavodoxin WrbA
VREPQGKGAEALSRILIIYHSQTGNTEKMAREVAKGVLTVENSIVTLKRADEAGLQDLLECDGLALGSPEYFGYMSGLLKDFFDRTYEAARGRREIFKKPYAAFISAGNDGTGALSSIERICLGYPLKKVYGAVVARGGVGREELAGCELLGATLAAGCEAGIY